VVTGSVRTLLRLEGAVIFVFAVGLYLRYGGSPWLLIPLLLAVDVSMAGYLANARLGALTYNALHSWAPGFVVLGLGLVSGTDGAVVAGAVLVSHVGMDRMLGYGLKYPTAFGDTHLGRIGRSR
jgi:hypothetical protein